MPKVAVKITKPTVRLMTLANCDNPLEKFGIQPLLTSASLQTPEHHWKFELDQLPQASESRRFGMPWERDEKTFRSFRKRLPSQITPSSILTEVVLPELQKPLDAPQRSEEWHQARAFAVTASNFAGTSDNAESLLKQKTYPLRHGFSGNSFTEWGAQHEKHAEEAFQTFLTTNKFDGKLVHPSHLRDATRPFLGFSPDALLWSQSGDEVELVEYKCPAGRRSGPGHPYSSDKLNVPSRYMPQLQGSMLLLRALYPAVKCVRAWFVVWQPHQFFVTHVPYVHLYASKTIDQAQTFFHGRFLPACVDAVLTREKSIPTFTTEEECFDFHESSDTSLRTSPDPPLIASSASSSPKCCSASSSGCPLATACAKLPTFSATSETAAST